MRKILLLILIVGFIFGKEEPEKEHHENEK